VVTHTGPGVTMQIFVNGLSGRTSSITTCEECTVGDFKLQLEDREGVPAELQRLVFAGRQLRDTSTLREASVAPADTLQLKLRLCGGTDYICGDCGQKNEIKPKDPIRCRICGYRIMYKMRTKNLIQFEAR